MDDSSIGRPNKHRSVVIDIYDYDDQVRCAP